jgi:hypothetical protein
MVGRKCSTLSTPAPSHKKQKQLQSSAILEEQGDDRTNKRKRKRSTSVPVESVPLGATVPSVSANSLPQDLGLPTPGVEPCAHAAVLHWHVKKVGSTRPLVLDTTTLFSSVRRLSVDFFKAQSTAKAISPDNLKKSAVNHFPTTVAYSSNIVAAPGKSKRLAQKRAAGLKRSNIITQEFDTVKSDADADNDDEPTRNLYDLPQTVLSYGTVESSTMRRYVLEDILQCEVGDKLYSSYRPITSTMCHIGMSQA